MPARSSQAYVESFAALLVAGCVSQGSSVRAYGYSQNVPSGILSTLGNYNTVSGDGEGNHANDVVAVLHSLGKSDALDPTEAGREGEEQGEGDQRAAAREQADVSGQG